MNLDTKRKVQRYGTEKERKKKRKIRGRGKKEWKFRFMNRNERQKIDSERWRQWRQSVLI